MAELRGDAIRGCVSGSQSVFQNEMLANPGSDLPHCHSATVAVRGGDVFVAWYAYPQEETQGAKLVFTRKRAGQDRFEKPRFVLPELTSSLGNPVLFFTDDGNLHLLYASLTDHYWDSAVTYQVTSEDEGDSWGMPRGTGLEKGIMLRYPPVARNNTYLLLPAYDESTNQTVIVTTDPEANAWFPVTTFDSIPSIQGCFVRQSGDSLAMILRPAGENRCCLRTLSADDGKTWGPVMRTTLPNPLSGVAAFSQGGALCAVYNHTNEHQRFPLSLSWSMDGGLSWEGPKHLDETEHEVSYPSFAVDDRGIAHGVYTFGRNRIQYVTFDESWWR